MHAMLVILCALGMGWGLFSKHRQAQETGLPVVSVMPIWLDNSTMARDSLVVSIICPAGTYQVLCTCPNPPVPYPDKEVVFKSKPREDGLDDAVWLVAFPPNDSLLVVVNNDSTLFTGFLAADSR